MPSYLACFLAAAAATALWAPSASADILSGYAQVQAGGAGGVGLFGDFKDDTFHGQASGLSYGGLVGVEVLLVDVWVEHNQYVGSDGLLGTWTQFMSGFDVEFDLGGKEGGVRQPDGSVKGGHSKLYGEFGIGLGFGVGTGQQVDPPLDNSQVSDKGFVFQAEVGAGFHVTKILSIGVSLPVQAGYMFKSDAGAANDVSTNYGSMQGAILLNTRIKLQIK